MIASACLFSLESGVALYQTPTTHDTNTRVKLTIVTILSFSERLAIAYISFIFFVRNISVRVSAPRFELTSQRQKVSRLPNKPPGRPYAI